MNGSLIVVGSGIKFISHLTVEAKTYIEQSDKVLYLINEPAMKIWIEGVNPNTESLDALYFSHRLRKDSYSAITQYILQTLFQQQHICVVLYGHPSVFAQPALDAVRIAKQKGYFAKILPGISTEDCLFADLLIDPASHGCLSLETTDLLLHQKTIDVSCHVILWQISVIGMLEHSINYDNSKGIKLLFTYLSKYYPSDHQLISYTASQYPGLDPIIIKFHLNQLPTIQFSRLSTLYIPPLKKPFHDKKILSKLDINLEDIIAT